MTARDEAALQARPSRGLALSGIVSSASAVLIGGLMLSWVALFNKAPLVFADSAGYTTFALQGHISGLFSIFYSVLILPLHLGLTLWPIVFVQGTVLAHLLYLTARCVSDGSIGTREFLLIVAGLCVLSALPWFTGQIMPDVFTPVVLLGTFLLAFCTDQLRRVELVYVGVLTAVAVTTHFAHVPIALGLILLSLALRPFFAPRAMRLRQWAAPALIPFVMAVATMMAVNWADTRQFGLARNSNVFLLAKLIGDGPALSYLERVCPIAGYALCAYVEQMKGLTQDDLKWGDGSPFHKIGSFDDLEPEARKIVRATLTAYPIEILKQAVLDTGSQLRRFAAGDGLTPGFASMVAERMAGLFRPDAATALVESRQGQGRLPIAEARRVHLVGLVLGLMLCFWIVTVGRRSVPTMLVALCIFVVAGIAWNAVVTGSLSAPHHRYLARVIWLVCFVGLLGGCYLARVLATKAEPVSR